MTPAMRFRAHLQRRRPSDAVRCAARSHWATCGSWPVHYRVIGQGPPLLLVHGLGSSSRYWESLAIELAERYCLIIPDLLGFGDSAKPYVAYDVDLHREALAAVVAAAVGETPLAAVVGHSLGSVLTLALLNRLPQPPAAAVLVTPPFPMGSGRMRQETRALSVTNRMLLSCVPVTRLAHVGMQAVWPAVCRVRGQRALFSPELLAEYGKYTYHSYMSTLNRCLFDYDLRPDVDSLGHVPTLVLQGADDPLVPVYHAPDLIKRLRHGHLERLPSRHHPVLSHPALVAEQVRNWLARHPAG